MIFYEILNEISCGELCSKIVGRTGLPAHGRKIINKKLKVLKLLQKTNFGKHRKKR